MPRAGIKIGDGCWEGHVIEFCDVFDTVCETGDHGSFNAWGRDRYWSGSATFLKRLNAATPIAELAFADAIKPVILRNNRWRCDYGFDVDLDDGATNYEITNNLMLGRGLKLRESFRRIVQGAGDRHFLGTRKRLFTAPFVSMGVRRPRLKMDKDGPVAFYHCVSRIVDRNFVLGDLEKEHFVKLMRVYETFCGVKVVTFCIMTNHFHILLEVPSRPAPEHLPSDEELVQLLKVAIASYGAATLAQRLQTLRAAAQHDEAEALREHFFSNMWDVSFYMRVLKQRFSQ